MQKKSQDQLLYSDFYDELIGLEAKRPKNYFGDGDIFPIGIKSRRPSPASKTGYEIIPENYEAYVSGDFSNLKEEDYVWFKNPFVKYEDTKNNEVLSMLFLAHAGLLKTVLTKRFAYYFKKSGVNILIFDPKSDDWELSSNIGSGSKCHPFETPDKLPMYNVIPSFVVNKRTPINIRERYEKTNRVFSNKIKEFDERRYWSTLAFSDSAKEIMLAYSKKFKSIEAVMDAVRKNQAPGAGVTLQHEVKRSILNRLGVLQDDNFFDSKRPNLDIKKCWDKDKVVAIHFYTSDERYISTTVGHYTYQLKYIQESQAQGVNMPKPILIICDDAGLYGKEPDMAKSLSVQLLSTAINIWRKLNFNTMFAIQNPDMLHHEIFDECKHIFCSKIGKASKLADYVGNQDIVWMIDSLIYEPENHVVEYCWIHPGKLTCSTFFPLGALIGHTW